MSKCEQEKNNRMWECVRVESSIREGDQDSSYCHGNREQEQDVSERRPLLSISRGGLSG
jgi:hypothetical protein